MERSLPDVARILDVHSAMVRQWFDKDTSKGKKRKTKTVTVTVAVDVDDDTNVCLDTWKTAYFSLVFVEKCFQKDARLIERLILYSDKTENACKVMVVLMLMLMLSVLVL